MFQVNFITMWYVPLYAQELRGLIDTESCKEGENCGWPLFDGILYLHLYWVGICIHYIPDNAFAPDIRTSSFSQQVSYLSEN